MANTLDDLFQWAAQQPSGSTTSVRIAMVTNELTRNNLVSYSEGALYYSPGQSSGMFFFPPTFASRGADVTQYFSDRRYPAPGESFATCPFACDDTDPLEVRINRPSRSGNYSVDLKSPKWGFDLSFDLSSDDATGIVYGVLGTSFITLSLCNRRSEVPPR